MHIYIYIYIHAHIYIYIHTYIRLVIAHLPDPTLADAIVTIPGNNSDTNDIMVIILTVLMIIH